MVRRIKAKLILKLRADGLSGRAISTSLGASRRSITTVLEAAEQRNISWDEVREKSENEVYALLFPGRGDHQSVFAQPDWSAIHHELAKVGVTLKLLHGEYLDAQAGSGQAVMGYDRFCKVYQRFVLESHATSRVQHKAGMSIEVDWSGPTMELVDPLTGQRNKVYLFVACLPFSRYAFVEATLDMKQESWLRAHVAMFEAFGGSVPRIVPDNLKTGVIKHPAEGEIVLNDSYRHLAAHYAAAVLPGRVRAPKDKASVENTVSHVASWVIAGLRKTTFGSLGQLRAAIRERVEAYNQEPFQKRAGSRKSVFWAEEQPLMNPLPAVSYEISTWVYGRKVARNSYVSWQKNYYSVPIINIGATVDLRLTESVLEVYRNHERITSHRLMATEALNQYRTNDSDIPPDRQWQHWDTQRVTDWASRTGPCTLNVVERIFESVQVKEQGFNAALAVLRLSRRYGPARLEAVCRIALQSQIRSPRYAHLRPLLETGQDKILSTQPELFNNEGGYVRGSDYYAGGTR
ncbi:IS21 family transposase [Paeniglutamicibacter sp. Y32M11]|uniref:IS21 family transposase n=1 Tax=Paeniglutamicibacter sp. Y32M11 TaxID=2853258 RepID=UPI001C53404F|nr:IS21 family transposase [Paeniglutamicibacter sp. Y32M11]QXQ10473.1 IS21 family transposase [Paeniglutamicibacter sp. Y32M11]